MSTLVTVQNSQGSPRQVELSEDEALAIKNFLEHVFITTGRDMTTCGRSAMEKVAPLFDAELIEI
ncbi:MAG: hypothetical protein QNJ81_02155 [Acidimicrobiia bacterium]|nr:hypothetical protein [Acidimicrobiia bacterium]